MGNEVVRATKSRGLVARLFVCPAFGIRTPCFILSTAMFIFLDMMIMVHLLREDTPQGIMIEEVTVNVKEKDHQVMAMIMVAGMVTLFLPCTF